MANAVYEVFTDLNPVELGQLAAETFMAWMRFALGKEELAGHKLKHPSGRYASALSWKRTGVASVAIIADESKVPEVGAIEDGRPAVDVKMAMLYGGNSRIGADGYRYRTIPLRPDQWRNTPILNPGMVLSGPNGGRLRSGVGRMWARERPYIDKKSRYRTMSNRPGASRWLVPEFHPYAPGRILSELLQQEFGRT